MFRFLVRYYVRTVYDKSGCCHTPFSKECDSCKSYCLRTTTAEAISAEAAIEQVNRFCKDGEGFTAEVIGDKTPTKEDAKYKDQR
jgi:hypothetical protein